MSGILRFGAYIPYFRLPKAVIGEAWAGPGRKGEKAVANYDEDSLTLAVEAARDCLEGWDRDRVDGIFFVSTTSPYHEKQGAGLIASVLGLRSDILTADFAHCLRSGITALELARICTETGQANAILVTFADTRTAHPGSPEEPWMGDGAAAFLIGKGRTGAEWGGFFSVSNEMMDVWRTQGERFIRTWEDRWVREHGLLASMSRAVDGLLARERLSMDRMDRLLLAVSEPRNHKILARRLGGRTGTKISDPLLDTVGAAGAAHGPLILAHELEKAGPGEYLLLAGYGDGADAMLLRTTEYITESRGRKGVSGHLEKRAALPNYERYLWHRGLVDVHPPQPLLVDSSATVYWRERDSILQLHGSRCSRCGDTAFPIQRICNRCGSKDAYEKIPLSEARGRLFTYTLDYLASPSAPPLIQTVVDLEPGCRLYTSMTDAIEAEVEIGMELEMTFRRTRRAAGFYNYFWRCRPAR